MKRHLAELGALTGRVVRSDELGSPEQAVAMSQAAQKFIGQSASRFEIKFSDKRSERFRIYIQSLMEANPSPIYVWIEHTKECGALLVPSLDGIDFNFDFDINDDGVLAFSTNDGADALLLDFSNTLEGEQVLTVLARGVNWERVRY